MKPRTIVAAVAVTAVLGAGLAGAQIQLDPALAPYKVTSGVSGNVSSVGSDTLNNLMTLWAEQFNKFYPNAKIQIEGKGSSTAPPALRIKLKVANRDLYGADFRWVDESQIATREYPPDVAVLERTESGALIGTIKKVRRGGQVVASGPGAGWAEVQRRLPGAHGATLRGRASSDP